MSQHTRRLWGKVTNLSVVLLVLLCDLDFVYLVIRSDLLRFVQAREVKRHDVLFGFIIPLRLAPAIARDDTVGILVLFLVRSLAFSAFAIHIHAVVIFSAGLFRPIATRSTVDLG